MSVEKSLPLLEARGLKKEFRQGGSRVLAVAGVDLAIRRGEVFGLVGESGCGKSTLGQMLVRLVEPTAGTVLWKGEDVTRPSRQRRKELCRQMQIVFQDPYASIDTAKTVGWLLEEPLKIHGLGDRRERGERADRILEAVGLDPSFRVKWPGELSGGQRQRVAIALALVLEPEFLVCDEPVSALDVSIQAQILNLMMDLQETRNLTYLFITHDLSVVKYVADEIMVMYLGQIVEKCPSDELFSNTLHPYSQALLSAIPIPDIHCEPKRMILRGELTSPVNPKPGCRFHSRCPYAGKECLEPQTLKEVSPGHWVACHRVQ